MTRHTRLRLASLGGLSLVVLVVPHAVLRGSSEQMGPEAPLARILTSSVAAAASSESVPGRPTRQESTGPTITYQGREIPRTDEAILDPKHTVLVVHEMLNDFISEGGASDKRGRRYQAGHIIEPIARLLAAARAKNVRVAYVRWTRHADGSTDADPGRRRALRGGTQAPSNIEGTWGWEEPEAIKPAPGDWVLPKWRQDAFFSSQLDALMRWNGIKTMVITGLGAEVGIMPSVMTASEMGYFTVVVQDAIAPSDPTRKEEAMKFLLGSAIIKNVKEMEEIWSKATPAPTGAESALAGQQPSSESPSLNYRGRQIPNSLEEMLNPKHTVLLVHEMLNDFISKSGAFDKSGRRIDAGGILQPMAELLAEARAKNVRVAYVRWTNYADNSTFSDPMLRRLLARSGPEQSSGWAVEGTPGWEIAEPVQPASGDWVIRKYRPDAFFATPLDTLMRWNGVKTVVIVGVGAEVGVVPTLMTASNLGYFTVAVSDCLRPTNAERMEDAMRYIADQAIVKTHTELLDIWRKASSKPTQ